MLPKLDILDVSASIGCNFNCTGCTQFRNYFSAGRKIKTDRLLEDLKVILPRIDINRVSIIGGEPLLNPRCEEIFRTALEYANNDVCLLYTSDAADE